MPDTPKSLNKPESSPVLPEKELKESRERLAQKYSWMDLAEQTITEIESVTAAYD
jgi:hypothetical protein